MHPFLRRTALAVIAVGCLARPFAQTPPAAVGEPIAIEFFASGPDGVVFDLRPEEVSLKVNGRARPVRSLRFVPLPAADPAAPVTEPVELEPPFGTNIGEAGGRWVTVVVDHESIKTGAERNAMNAAVRFVQALGPRDYVSFARMPRGGVEIPHTTNHQVVVDALRKFVGTAPREETERDRACRSRDMLFAIRNLLEDVAGLSGPKIIAVVSSGVLNPRRDAPLNAPPGQCEIRTEDFHNIRVAAAQARAYVFVVQPDNLVVESALTSLIDPNASRFAAADEDRHGLQSLAGAAAGEFMQIVGPADTNLANIARATAGYYIATFEPDPSERNAATHRMDVSVMRGGVRVRARPEVIIPRPVQAKPASTSPRDMLRDPAGTIYRALPLRAVAYQSASENGKVKILTVLETPERDAKIASAVFGLIDTVRNKLVVQWTANARELAMLPIVTAGEAAPGPYRLRVAAVDANGRQGTVEYEFMATLADAKPLTLSALALGTSSEAGFAPKLIFGGDQAAVAYLEAYGPAATPDSVAARLEVAASPDARALATAVPRVINASEDRRMIVGAIPIASLPPGDYVVRAIVSVDGRPVGRVVRTLRKSIAR